MSKAAFDKIAEGLTDALSFARGDVKAAKLHVPPEIDVRAIRAKAGMSQDAFASTFGFSVHQIRQWEQGRHRPIGPVRAYLLLIDSNPKKVAFMLRAASSERDNDAEAA